MLSILQGFLVFSMWKWQPITHASVSFIFMFVTLIQQRHPHLLTRLCRNLLRLPRSPQRPKPSWKQSVGHGKILNGRQNRARKKEARCPPANLKHPPASFNQVTQYFIWKQVVIERLYCFILFYLLSVVKRLPEHVQVDDPAALKKLAKKLERQQVRRICVNLFSISCDNLPWGSRFFPGLIYEVINRSTLHLCLTEVRAWTLFKYNWSQGLAPHFCVQCIVHSVYFCVMWFLYFVNIIDCS